MAASWRRSLQPDPHGQNTETSSATLNATVKVVPTWTGSALLAGVTKLTMGIAESPMKLSKYGVEFVPAVFWDVTLVDVDVAPAAQL